MEAVWQCPILCSTLIWWGSENWILKLCMLLNWLTVLLRMEMIIEALMNFLLFILSFIHETKCVFKSVFYNNEWISFNLQIVVRCQVCSIIFHQKMNFTAAWSTKPEHLLPAGKKATALLLLGNSTTKSHIVAQITNNTLTFSDIWIWHTVYCNLNS